MIWLCWGVTAALALTDWLAVARDDRRTETWAKPATLVALWLTALASGAAGYPAGVWLLVALAFGLLGDVLLLGSSTARFQGGLAAFLVGHLAYVVSLVILGLDQPRWTFVGLVVVTAALVTARHVLPAAHRSEGLALSLPVGVYMLVISAMAMCAWATGSWLIAAGASVFVASDTILAVDRFVEPRSWARLAIMVTYHVGQALIVLGFAVAG